MAAARLLIRRALALVVVGLVPGAATATPALSPTARAILDGARAEVQRRTRYDFSMAYHLTSYKDGRDTGRPVTSGGDIDPALGVCTDLVVRAMRRAGHDLQALVSADCRRAPRAYPALNRIDPNIDHRRVPNLVAFLRRHGIALTLDTSARRFGEWRPGDIVVWHLKGKGRMDHIGLISDRRDPASGRPLVIHNYPMPGYTSEADVLTAWRVAAHFRFPASQ